MKRVGDGQELCCWWELKNESRSEKGAGKWNIIRLEIVWLLFFFFQAEDGIRDVAVTGVQTCALPISRKPVKRPAGPRPSSTSGAASDFTSLSRVSFRNSHTAKRCAVCRALALWLGDQIGRASCRERV